MSDQSKDMLQLRSLVKASGELEVSLARVAVPEPGADEVLVWPAVDDRAIHGFFDRTNWKDADSIEAQPLEGVLQRLRDSLHHDDDRRCARGRGAAHLIFDQGSAGERQQRAQSAFIVLLISSDQSADRQFASPRPPH